jgi:uncharacterized protein (DUF1778 family)
MQFRETRPSVKVACGKKVHTFILDAIEQTVEQAEIDADFHRIANERWAGLVQSGNTVPWTELRPGLRRTLDRAVTRVDCGARLRIARRPRYSGAPGRADMSTITVRIEDDFKARVAAAATGRGHSVQSFVLEALALAVERAEIDAELHRIADERWARLLSKGRPVSAEDARKWLSARARDERRCHTRSKA